MTKLTEKQRQFVAAKAAGCTNRDAAISAGYSVAAASSTADKLMASPAIRAALKAAGKNMPAVDTKPVNMPTMPRTRYADSMSFLMDILNHAGLPIAMRLDAAKALLPYQHARIGEVGKRQAAKDRAHAAVAGGKRGRFQPKQPPQLTVVRNNKE